MIDYDEYDLTKYPEKCEKPPLNAGQQAAADGFFEFLFDSSKKKLIISGGGGFGKTTLMGHLIDEVMPHYFNTCRMMDIRPEYDNVEMVATTNKAAEVLAQATGRDTKTLASFLNLKVQDDYTTGRSKLIKTRNWMVHQKKIIFVDECSMLSPAEEAALDEGTYHCKIVYVGDHCQLAPVGYERSPIYDQDLPFFNLTEPMRNAEQPALMALCQQLRETVETGVFKPIQTVDGVIDLLDDEEMQEGIEFTFLEQTKKSRIIAYTNARVVEYNEHIRDMRALPQEYGVGEILVNASAIQFGKRGAIAVEAEVEILSTADQTELMVIEDQTDFVNLEVRRATLRSSLGKVFEDIPLPADRQHYADLIKWYGRRKNWNRMYYIKNNVPDLRPRDAATTYKVQGSTYDSVFIDLGNLSLCNKPSEVARALYVALSRARVRVLLYGSLAAKYGGVIS